MTQVISLDSDQLNFDDGSVLFSEHEQDCCEQHYLSFADLSLSDFEGLEFDLTSDSFFERVEDYGIRLLPIKGHPLNVPGYGYNNGYYCSNLSLVLTGPNKRVFDITDCQVVGDD